MVFTPEERKALLALVALLLLGQAFALWEQHRRSRPDRELSQWLEQVERARGASPGESPAAGAFPADSSAGGELHEEADTGPAQKLTVEPRTSVPPGILHSGRLRINEASARDLETLPGIGPALARRILEERARSGPFRRPSDLLRVKGIGPKKLSRLAPGIDCGEGGGPPP